MKDGALITRISEGGAEIGGDGGEPEMSLEDGCFENESDIETDKGSSSTDHRHQRPVTEDLSVFFLIR